MLFLKPFFGRNIVIENDKGPRRLVAPLEGAKAIC